VLRPSRLEIVVGAAGSKPFDRTPAGSVSTAWRGAGYNNSRHFGRWPMGTHARTPDDLSVDVALTEPVVVDSPHPVTRGSVHSGLHVTDMPPATASPDKSRCRMAIVRRPFSPMPLGAPIQCTSSKCQDRVAGRERGNSSS